MAGLEKIKVAVKSKDIVLRDPVSKQRITVEGKIVPKNSFWLRRLKAGDVVQLPLQSKGVSKTETPKKKEGMKDGDTI